MLILAGVALRLALGENGILKMSKSAANVYKEKSKEEEDTLNEIEKQLGDLTSNSSGEQTPTQPEGPKELVTSVNTTEHKTVYAEDSLGNPVTVPGGFKVVAGANVEDGIVIADDEENEFVWIPVSNINGNSKVEETDKAEDLIKLKNETTVEITLGRYTFADTASKGTPTLVQSGSEHTGREEKYKIPSFEYQEITTAERTNGGEGAKALVDFVTSVEKNHGYYLARYEASYKSGSSVADYKIYSKPSTNAIKDSWSNTPGMLWNWITQGDAATISRNMYSGNDVEATYVESDLVNSYAWDTAIVYIQAMGNENYANVYDGNGNIRNTGAPGDEKCHIFDMATNVCEWTTEYCTYNLNDSISPCVTRGGNYDNIFGYASSRSRGSTTGKNGVLGFRPLLYLK